MLTQDITVRFIEIQSGCSVAGLFFSHKSLVCALASWIGVYLP